MNCVIRELERALAACWTQQLEHLGSTRNLVNTAAHVPGASQGRVVADIDQVEAA
jgi:hypothetical protein